MDTVKFEVNIRYFAFTVVALFAVLGVSAYFIYEDPAKFEIKTTLDIVAVVMAVGAVFYAALNIHLMRMKSQEDLQLGKKARSADIIASWNTPDMSKIAVAGSVVREKELNADELLEYLRNNLNEQEAFFTILNFFERLALLVDNEVIDEIMVKEYFKNLVVLYWLSFQGFVRNQREKLEQPNYFQKFEELYIKWTNEYA